jgi:hypothetical protein
MWMNFSFSIVLEKNRVWLSVCSIKHHSLKIHGIEIKLHTFMVLALMKWVVSFMPQLLYLLWKRSWYMLDTRLDCPWSQLLRTVTSLAPARNQILGQQAHSQVSVLTELSQLFGIQRGVSSDFSRNVMKCFFLMLGIRYYIEKWREFCCSKLYS